jgi:hypothetical protein
MNKTLRWLLLNFPSHCFGIVTVASLHLRALFVSQAESTTIPGGFVLPDRAHGGHEFLILNSFGEPEGVAYEAEHHIVMSFLLLIAGKGSDRFSRGQDQ